MTRLIATRCQLENTDKNANEIIHNPFRSLKQRNFLKWKHPVVYRNWVKKYGKKIVKK